MNHENFSPAIEEFSEGDDIFLRSQEGEDIAKINEEFLKIHELKPKYKPANKDVVSGGLLAQFRLMKNSRQALACKFVQSDETKNEQQKIEVVNYSEFRRRLVIKFNFVDTTNEDLNAPITHHYLVLPIEFEKLVQLHSFYDVAFDLPPREFLANHFMHFGQQIKAARMV